MLSDESETEDIHSLTINEHFARAYEYRKEREELAKLKEKYGSDIEEDGVDEEDSEEAESEDEDGEELTPAVDAAILRTLARIRRKDPSIYESENNVFEEEREKTGDAAPSRRVHKDKSRPITMRQHALASALNPESRSPSPEPLTHVKEQAALRQETIAAFHTAVAKDEDEDDFLVPREKTKDELEQEEEEYRAFLEREVGEDLKEIVTLEVPAESEGLKVEEDPAGHAKKKRKTKVKEEVKATKSKQEEDQEFLMNYILNRGWIDRSTRRLPTYKEITASKKNHKGKGKASSSDANASGSEGDVKEESESEGSIKPDEDEVLDEDEFEEVADRFESSYNFRFEEPEAATIPRYPRNLPSLVRRQDTSRKEAREKRKERKEEELLKKKEEVKRLKALKMKDIRTKLEKIGKEGGKSLEASKALQELDLEGDWDPDKHDRQMAELYEPEGDEDVVDDEKPQWDDDIDVGEIALPEEEDRKSKKKKKKKKKDVDGLDEGGVDLDEMDADVQQVRGDDDEEWDGTEEMRKRKLEEYMDEVYGLEFNDMVGDMPTRFKYAKVAPQTFGLAPTEILLSTDAELNSYVGIKKYAPYRKDGKGKLWDNTRTARLKELKDKLRERGVEPENGRTDSKGDKVKKRKGKKERMKERAAAGADNADEEEKEGDRSGDAKRERSSNSGKRRADEASLQDEHTGDAPTKKKRRRHKKTGFVDGQQDALTS